ncbi:MAG: low molecular weight phosphotyrosine protein phosphatase [Caldilineales bacterium]|nr:low molecular weight phosphotyrosine protein phosphatase [Caldilineales bacterium]
MTSTQNKPVRVLFVCLGNICRSPTAQAVFEYKVRAAGLEGAIEIDSAGTSAYHIGEQPDRRAQLTARRRGIDMSGQRSRQVSRIDCERFDYILAMDSDNLYDLRRLCSPEQSHKLARFLDFAPQAGIRDVPDPYYGGSSGFENVFDLIEMAADGLLADIVQTRLNGS